MKTWSEWKPLLHFVMLHVFIHHTGHVTARSLSISITHRESLAVSDPREQEVVSLDKVNPDLRAQLEKEIRKMDIERAPMENQNMFMRKRRRKRSLDLNKVANQEWELEYTKFETQAPDTATAVPFDINRESNSSVSNATVVVSSSTVVASTTTIVSSSTMTVASNSTVVASNVSVVASNGTTAASNTSVTEEPKQERKVISEKDLETAKRLKVISEKDLETAKRLKVQRVLQYVGLTLLAVCGATVLILCLILNPTECIMAFGMGSPCCLVLSPCCIACLGKIADPKKAVRDNMNYYAPGLIIYDDGKTEYYEASQEEMACLEELMDKVTSLANPM